MKKRILAATCVLAMSVSAVPAFAADSIKVLVNDKEVAFTGQQPVIMEGSTLIPVRGALEAMGVEVKWDAATKTVDLAKGEMAAKLTLGEKTFMAGTEKKDLSAAAQNIGGSTMIPLRAVAEYFGATVAWDDTTKTVAVKMAEEAKPETEPKTETKPEASVAYTTATYEASAKAEDSSVLISAKAEYPQLAEATSTHAKTINAKIEKEAKEAIDAYLAARKDDAAKEAKELGKDFRTNTCMITFEAPFCDGNVFSYLETYAVYTGGAHGNYVVDGSTYDLKTGAMKEMKDFITLESNVTADQYVKNMIKADMEKNPTAYLTDAAKTLAETKVPTGFYFNEKGEFIVFLAEPTVVKPYSEGIVKFVCELEKAK